MTREEIRAYVRANPLPWKPFSAAQLVRLAVLLRPDLPVGIHTKNQPGPGPERSTREAVA
jgi:hypothetical protein